MKGSVGIYKVHGLPECVELELKDNLRLPSAYSGNTVSLYKRASCILVSRSIPIFRNTHVINIHTWQNTRHVELTSIGVLENGSSLARGHTSSPPMSAKKTPSWTNMCSSLAKLDSCRCGALHVQSACMSGPENAAVCLLMLLAASGSTVVHHLA